MANYTKLFLKIGYKLYFDISSDLYFYFINSFLFFSFLLSFGRKHILRKAFYFNYMFYIWEKDWFRSHGLGRPYPARMERASIFLCCLVSCFKVMYMFQMSQEIVSSWIKLFRSTYSSIVFSHYAAKIYMEFEIAAVRLSTQSGFHVWLVVCWENMTRLKPCPKILLKHFCSFALPE